MNPRSASNSRSLIAVLSASSLLLPVGSASAALAITNGTFGNANMNAQTVSDGGSKAPFQPNGSREHGFTLPQATTPRC